VRHASNIGCFANVQFVVTQAAGRYVVYLSDDDCVLGEPLARAIAAMEDDPGIAVTYAPWLLYDLVDQRTLGQFYQVPHDLRVRRGEHAELLGHILKHHIFPEIHIARRDVLQRLMPRINEHAFYAFVQAADYLGQGDVLIRQEPFYVSITRYFADEQRTQAGNEEVEYAWDRYRGGLEYLMARAGDTLGAEERAGFALRIQQMIAVRMSVAIRLRHAAHRDPVDTYTIAMRLRGMGYEGLSPVPLPLLASQATLHFLLRDPLLNRGVEQLVCIGRFDAGTAGYLKQHAQVPVRFCDQPPRAEELRNTLLFVDDEHDDSALDDMLCAGHNLQVVRVRDLCARFGL
jgi:poly(ribitol-phosphate) beta-N-acetylglucosaminyltransferase